MVASRAPSRSPSRTPRTPRVQPTAQNSGEWPGFSINAISAIKLEVRRISDEALCLQMQQLRSQR